MVQQAAVLTAVKQPNPIPGNKPFKKGQSGNPNGRPKKLPELDKLLAEVLGEEKDGITAADAILRKLRAMAAQGNIRAIELLLDRAYGKAKQTVDMEVTQRMTIVDDIPPIDTAITEATPSLGPAEGQSD